MDRETRDLIWKVSEQHRSAQACIANGCRWRTKYAIHSQHLTAEIVAALEVKTGPADDSRRTQREHDERVINTVPCPTCRSAKKWPCTSANGKATTLHSARYRAFREWHE